MSPLQPTTSRAPIAPQRARRVAATSAAPVTPRPGARAAARGPMSDGRAVATPVRTVLGGLAGAGLGAALVTVVAAGLAITPMAWWVGPRLIALGLGPVGRAVGALAGAALGAWLLRATHHRGQGRVDRAAG